MNGYRALSLLVMLALAACQVPNPYTAPRPQSPPPSNPSGSPPQVPAPSPSPQTRVPAEEEPVPAPAPPREPTLNPASRSLVTQAQKQSAAGDYAGAAAVIERALRIEPDNPLLWLELARVRQAEGNHQQAENFARKALSMLSNAPRTQAAAWRLISESLRARGRNSEARAAQSRAEALNRG